jgi:hypothetical protein
LTNFLVKGFSFGFHIPYQGPRNFRSCKNLPSINSKEKILRSKLEQELKTKRIAGPFVHPPFPNLQVSPIGLVPKKNSGEFRLIHHLSYPEGGSINDHIPRDLCSVQYQSIATAIDKIKQVGTGALLAKADIENAYKQVPSIQKILSC